MRIEHDARNAKQSCEPVVRSPVLVRSAPRRAAPVLAAAEAREYLCAESDHRPILPESATGRSPAPSAGGTSLSEPPVKAFPKPWPTNPEPAGADVPRVRDVAPDLRLSARSGEGRLRRRR
jgi:hypothetical protein